MAECMLMQGGGGIKSDDVTAKASDVRAGKTYLGADSDDDIKTGTFAPSTKAVLVGISSWDNDTAGSLSYTCTGSGRFYCAFTDQTTVKINNQAVATGNIPNSTGTHTGTNYKVQCLGRTGEAIFFRWQTIKAGDVITMTSEDDLSWTPALVNGVVVYD